MSKYRRWERPVKTVPAWLTRRRHEQREWERECSARLRASFGGLRCEACLEAVSHSQFMMYQGLCVRCWQIDGCVEAVEVVGEVEAVEAFDVEDALEALYGGVCADTDVDIEVVEVWQSLESRQEVGELWVLA